MVTQSISPFILREILERKVNFKPLVKTLLIGEDRLTDHKSYIGYRMAIPMSFGFFVIARPL